MKVSSILTIFLSLIILSLPACQQQEEPTEAHHKVVVTSPKAMNVVLTEQYVCQIHSKLHIEVCALMNGYLEEITVKEGQEVSKDDLLFKVRPILYEARLEAEKAEAQLAQLEYFNTEKLYNDKVVSQMEVALYKAKLEKAKAKVKLSQNELNFTKVTAAFPGIIDRLYKQQGSLIKEGDILTTLSDNSVMWVYFNVPEAGYLEYQALSEKEKAEQKIELQLANGTIFPQAAIALRIEGKFNNETGTIPFRADFPNPNRLLRYGMTGNILIHRTLKNAIVIPQRATFEILAKRYVYVLGENDKVKQREIVVDHEQEDIFVLKSGVTVNDKIVYEGVQMIRDGNKVDFEFRPPEKILGHQKNPAE